MSEADRHGTMQSANAVGFPDANSYRSVSSAAN
jgi:hypothetical protein